MVKDAITKSIQAFPTRDKADTTAKILLQERFIKHELLKEAGALQVTWDKENSH